MSLDRIRKTSELIVKHIKENPNLSEEDEDLLTSLHNVFGQRLQTVVKDPKNNIPEILILVPQIMTELEKVKKLHKKGKTKKYLLQALISISIDELGLQSEEDEKFLEDIIYNLIENMISFAKEQKHLKKWSVNLFSKCCQS